LLAACLSICHFRYFCEDHQFQLWTDYKPLPIPHAATPLAFISEFNVQMLYLLACKMFLPIFFLVQL
jgi:hypothetical protein